MTDSFIDSLSKHILSHSNTNALWAKTLAMTTFSPFLHRVSFSNKKGEVRPNLYAMMIGPSGLAEKTLPMQTVIKPILTSVDKMLINQMGKIDEDDVSEEYETANGATKRKKMSYYFQIPNEYSLEKMTSILNKRKNGIIVSDEFTGLLKTVKGKEYMSATLEYISRVYDGDAGFRATKKSGYENASGLCVSMVTATTPYIYDVMKPDFFVQGTGNRFLMVIYNLDTDKILIPDDYYDMISSDLSSDRIKRVNNDFVNNIVSFYRFMLAKSQVMTMPTPNAAQSLRAFISGVKNSARELFKADRHSLEYSYIDRMELNINKVVMNITCSRAYAQFLNGEFESSEDHATIQPEINFPIETNDADEAIALMDTYRDQFSKMLDEWSKTTSRREVPVYSMTAILQEISSYISVHADDSGWCNRRKMIRDLKIDSRQFEDFQKVYLDREVRSTGGRSSIWVRMRED